MPKAMKKILQDGYSIDETDRTPDNIHISNLDVIMYCVAIVGHLVDLGFDINVAARYFLAQRMTEFYWTLAFILLPAFVNTAVSIRMYAQDKSQEDTMSNQFTKIRVLRIFVLFFQMAPILRFADALIYALKARRAERMHDPASQRRFYRLMLKEDSDAALLRIFECFLEAAPQQTLQMTYLYLREEQFTVHQLLSISSSVVSMGWCLAAYQRAIRFAQEDKLNMGWFGTLLQILWHFLVTLSRITCISVVAFIAPHWTVLACVLHAFAMASWLQFYDRSPFCAHHRLAELSFSIVLGLVYIFTYILPVEGRTRYRYAIYYSVCFVENVVCAVLFYLYVDGVMRHSILFYPLLVLSVIPYVVGLTFMIVYYAFFHPKSRKGVSDRMSVQFKVNDQIVQVVN